MATRLTSADIKGVIALLPSVAKPGADALDARDTVDTDGLAWFIENVISQGVHCISLLGTMGEGMALTREEWEVMVRTAVEVVNKRVPLFCGTTTLNTRDTVDRTRFVMKAGADGVMNGVPMWLQPSVDNAIQFYKDIATAVPEAAIMIYHNPAAFRVTLPPAAWAQLAEIPQIIAVKQTVADINNTIGMIRAVKGRISVMVGDKQMYPAMMFGASGGWSTRSSISPAPVLRLYEAAKRGDWAKADEISQDVGYNWPPCTMEEFHIYDTPLVKAIINAGTGGKAGPVRRPFVHLPEHLQKAAKAHGENWARLAEKYKAPVGSAA